MTVAAAKAQLEQRQRVGRRQHARNDSRSFVMKRSTSGHRASGASRRRRRARSTTALSASRQRRRRRILLLRIAFAARIPSFSLVESATSSLRDKRFSLGFVLLRRRRRHVLLVHFDLAVCFRHRHAASLEKQFSRPRRRHFASFKY